MNAFPKSYTRGARLLRDLAQLKRGQNYRMSAQMLSDIEVPANLFDHQSPAYLAKWMHERMPFYCTLHHDLIGDWWEICRPAQDDLQQRAQREEGK